MCDANVSVLEAPEIIGRGIGGAGIGFQFSPALIGFEKHSQPLAILISNGFGMSIPRIGT